jgi:1,5-anhydro-D-fructose reductase (1,5-anhydro-D-mannitol-forming)
MGASESKPLPPWFQSEGVQYEPALSERIQALSTTAAPFLTPNPKYFQSFELEAHLPRLQGALTFDKHIAAWYPRLVPSKVSEPEFWQNYFSHVAALVTEGAEPPKGEEVAAAGGVTEVQSERKETPSSAAAQPAASSSAVLRTPSGTRLAIPAVPVSSLSPPPLFQSPLPIAAPAASANASWNLHRITPQHVVDSGMDLGHALVAQLAGLHHNMPHILPQTLFQPTITQQQPTHLELGSPSPVASPVESRLLFRAPALRWGVIGCGSLVQTFTVPALLRTNGGRLVAVTCRTAASRNAFAAKCGLSRAHPSVAALLADPEVDAVYIATPPGSHAALASEALRHRKPVVLEKVMARSGEECRQIAEEFSAAGVPLIVNQHKRMLPKFQAVQQLLRTHVGIVHSVHYQLSSPLAQQLHDTLASAGHWRMDVEQSGGGLFLEFGAEFFDIMEHLFGPITHVQGDAIHSPLSEQIPEPKHALENVLSMTFRLCDLNALQPVGRASLSPARRAPILSTANFNFVVSQQVDQLMIQGAKGQLSCSLFGTDGPVLRSTDGKVALIQLPPMENPHLAWLQQVTDELRVWRSSPSSPNSLSATSASSAVRTGQVLDSVLRSYYRNRSDAFWKRAHTWNHGLPLESEMQQEEAEASEEA